MLLPLLLLAAPLTDESPWVTDLVAAPGVQRVIYASRSAKQDVSFHVWLPPGVTAGQKEGLPTLYWLHGSGGGQGGIRPLSQWFSSSIRAGRIPPMILVFPNGLANGMWCDSTDGKSPLETMLIKEIIPLVERQFPAQSDRKARIIEGFSMGGYGAGRLGFSHPKSFCAVSMLGAGPVQTDLFDVPMEGRGGLAERQRIFEEVFGGTKEGFLAKSPWRLAEKLAASRDPRPLLRMAIGGKDFTLPANEALHLHLNELKIEHTFTKPSGVGHDPMALLKALGDDNWEFYRKALGKR